MRLGARMVPFAGYDMPVQYPFIKENLFTRAAAGLFNVSHVLDDLMVSNQGDRLMLIRECRAQGGRRGASSPAFVELLSD